MPNPVVTRQQIIRGPGRVTVGSLVIDDKDQINCVMESTRDDINTSLRGKVDEIATDNIIHTTLTPFGAVTQGLLDFFYKWQPTDIGASVFGNVDVPMLIHSRRGTKLTLVNSSLTKPPPLYLSPTKTPFGQIEITSLLGLTAYAGDIEAFSKLTTEAFPEIVQEKPKTGAAYFGTYGGFSINDTEDGWTIEWELLLTPEKTSNRGTIDYTVKGVKVTAKCVPVDKTEADIIGALPINKKLGSSLATGDDLVISPLGDPGLIVTLKNASLVSGPLNWGSDKRRIGELVWQANLDATTSKLYTVAIAA